MQCGRCCFTELEQLDKEQEATRRQNNEDVHFGVFVSDMFAKIDSQHKPEVQFKIHKILFEAQTKYLKPL